MKVINALLDAGVRRVYSAAETRELDRRAIEQHGIAGIVLMRRAGQAAWRALRRRWPEARTLTIVCGRGNNAGDGYVIAGLACSRRLQVQLLQVGDAAALRGDAARARDWALEQGVTIEAFSPAVENRGDLVIDALLGTGIRGEVRDEFARAIDWINRQPCPRVAVDVPSGIAADSGAELGCAVRADLTPTFIGCKRGLLTGAGVACAGEVLFDDLEVPEAVFSAPDAPAGMRLIVPGLAPWQLPARSPDAHKGSFGHVLIVGGDAGMGGAVALAAEAALRCGAGLVSAATQPVHVAPLLARNPEVMAHGVGSPAELEPLLARASVVVAGPGLGQGSWGEQLLDAVLQADRPLVLDADALNLLARRPERRDDWILTPHPGEAARLLEMTTAQVGEDRCAALALLCERYGGTALLKGAGTLVGSGEGMALSAWGNPGMASGGMGDVLSGVIGALLAQTGNPALAAELGVALHGKAADLAAQDGQQGLLARDLMTPLRQLLAEVCGDD